MFIGFVLFVRNTPSLCLQFHVVLQISIVCHENEVVMGKEYVRFVSIEATDSNTE